MIIVVILVFLVSFFLVYYFSWYNSAEQKGKRGELYIASVLTQLSDEYYILNDVVYKTKRGITQIDHIVVSKYGVFTIETKNYRGEIYGDDNREKWTQIITTDVTYAKKWYKTYTYVKKNHFYNPVKQSLGHAYRIKQLLSEYPYLKIVPIVVFTGEAILRNIESNHHVVYKECLVSVINSYRTIYLTDNDVQHVLNILLNKDRSSVVTNTEHVNNLYAKEYLNQRKINSGICPRCGGRLILRNGKYGSFYGCSNYPKCRFIENAEE